MQSGFLPAEEASCSSAACFTFLMSSGFKASAIPIFFSQEQVYLSTRDLPSVQSHWQLSEKNDSKLFLMRFSRDFTEVIGVSRMSAISV